ncbi:MAG: ABC transporter substrate-binding protein [Chloroflexi bacterium]|nr:ABC transporter substrate-binding protein [Chloroflexota bacterium]MBT3669276.1 ABC transporter substrate-binding protein [Chloroflexota bacterium]MBT4003101.1 ABC transporter substrate-binding protein [Chloroflexota bacterium]MBT4305983.1 ABC transporter substrate-binding protein [Chloroflexota bacterium]MBT4532627.1 ABC transporter substrate-binding protein [Chloroflexota bacterium]
MLLRNKLLCLLALIFLVACGKVDQSPPIEKDQSIEIRLPMGYIPNIQYAPFYVAVEKGYFSDAGFEIEFDYSFETDGVALVGANELPFAIVSGEQVLLAREQGIPVVYVMAWFQDYPITVISKADAGIEKIEDLAGKTIGIPGPFGASYIGLRALLSEAGILESDVVLESIGFTQVEAIAGGQSEIVVGYINNEPVQLRDQGFDFDLFSISDYVQLPANGIITNEKTISENPDMINKFIEASLLGLAYAIDHPEEAYEISLKFVESLAEQDEVVQKEILALSIEYWKTEKLGFSNIQAWENMQNVLLEIGLISKSLDLEDVFTNQFVE